MNGLYLKAAIETKDFEKEMAGLGYPFKCHELPCLEYSEYGAYVPFLLTDKAIKEDYEAANYEKEVGCCNEEYIIKYHAQADMRKNLRTWVNDDAILIHFTW